MSESELLHNNDTLSTKIQSVERNDISANNGIRELDQLLLSVTSANCGAVSFLNTLNVIFTVSTLYRKYSVNEHEH